MSSLIYMLFNIHFFIQYKNLTYTWHTNTNIEVHDYLCTALKDLFV